MPTNVGSDHKARRVGDVAAAAGLTVRTLHYYEEIGLLVPSLRSASGHRLYTPEDLQRLYQIALLRPLGLPLIDIGRVLDEPQWDLRAALTRHLAQIDGQLELVASLRRRVVALIQSLEEQGVDTENRPPSDDLLGLLEEMRLLDSSVRRRVSYLVYSDVQKAYDYLVRVFGLGPGSVTRDAEDVVVHAEVHAGDGVIWLHPESARHGLASPRSVGSVTAGTAVMVDDVDAHFRSAVDQGADIVYEPVDQPYGYREYSARDVEGGLWSFMKPLP